MKISTTEQLRELYNLPKGRAKAKVKSKLEKHAINFIEFLDFFVISRFIKS